jgi:hypothetical protein
MKQLQILVVLLALTSNAAAQWGTWEPDIDPRRIIQGVGSGLDADLLHGAPGTDYAQKGLDETITGEWSIENTVSVYGGNVVLYDDVDPSITINSSQQFISFGSTNSNSGVQRALRFYDSVSDAYYTLGWMVDTGLVVQVVDIAQNDPTNYYLVLSSFSKIENLSNVDVTGVANDSILVYDALAEEWVIGALPSVPSLDMNDLSDVNAPTPADNDILIYDLTSETWLPGPLPAEFDIGTASIKDLSDVGYTGTPTGGSIMKYDTVNNRWTASSLSLGEISDVSYGESPPMGGEILIHTGSGWGLSDITTEASSISLSDLGNVTFGTPSNNDMIRYNTSTSRWVNFTPDYLAGVVVTTPSDNQLIRYNNATGKWVNFTPDYPTLAGNNTFTGINGFGAISTTGLSFGTGFEMYAASDMIYITNAVGSTSIVLSDDGYVNVTGTLAPTSLETANTYTNNLYLNNSTSSKIYWTASGSPTVLLEHASQSGTNVVSFVPIIRVPSDTVNGVPALTFGSGTTGIWFDSGNTRITANSNFATRNVLPETNSVYNIGSSTANWASGFFTGTVSAGTLATTTLTSSGMYTGTGGATISRTSNTPLDVRFNSPTANAWAKIMHVGTNSTESARLEISGYRSATASVRKTRIQSLQGTTSTSTAPLLLNPSGGNVSIGMGDTTPAFTLDTAAGSIRAGQFTINDTSRGLYYDGDFADGVADLGAAYIGDMTIYSSSIIGLNNVQPPTVGGTIDISGVVKAQKLAMTAAAGHSGSTHLVWYNDTTKELTIEAKSMTPVVFVNGIAHGKILMNWESTNETQGRLKLPELTAGTHTIEIWNVEDQAVWLNQIQVQYELVQESMVTLVAMPITLPQHLQTRDASYTKLSQSEQVSFDIEVDDIIPSWLEVHGFYETPHEPKFTSSDIDHYIQLRQTLLDERTSQ